MSAITGLVGLDRRPVAAIDVERMVETMAHRGPDGRHVWVEGDAGLGHCMLHTTPESLTEHLPLRRGHLAITADARLDNRTELMRALGVDGRAERVSDSELILEAYLRWGEDCPSHLLGDFAFAIWDSQRRELFCARDHFGVRPFYYFHQAGRRFVFGTEIKSLFALADIPRRLDEAKIADFMLVSLEDKARTFYLDINRLPPASTLVAGPGGVRIRQYWALDPERKLRLDSDEEYAEAFRELFVAAVDCRLRSAFPVGSMLSGGLDSSSIACVAAELLSLRGNADLHTFSIVFDKVARSDERRYIEQVLSARRFSSHLIDGDSVTPFDDLDSVLRHQDEPFNTPNFSLTRSAWRAAGGSGVRVLLDGVFGDNVVSHGREHLRSLALRWQLVPLARELRAYLRITSPGQPTWPPVIRYVIENGIKPYIPETGLRAWRGLRGRPRDVTASQCALFAAPFRDRYALGQRLAAANDRDRSPRSSRQAHADSLQCGIVESALEIYGPGCAEFGLEARFPFIDKRLVEFCVAVPGEQKVSQGYSRVIVRRALEQYLPDAIRLRHDKGNLSWSFTSGVRSKRDLALRALDSSSPFLGRFFDPARIRSLHDRYASEALSGEDLVDVFLIVVLSEWHSRGSQELSATSDMVRAA